MQTLSRSTLGTDLEPGILRDAASSGVWSRSNPDIVLLVTTALNLLFVTLTSEMEVPLAPLRASDGCAGLVIRIP
jgi:hypothetical protein